MLEYLYLTSGLFLGWTLGANNAGNVFGAAVGSGMLKFRTAAAVTCVFVIIGASFSGTGTSNTLQELGHVNELAGAFIVALATALAVYWMTSMKLPVPISQAIVGAIIGWNIFAGKPTELSAITKILATWVCAPILSAVFAIVIYKIATYILSKARIHMLKLDHYNRIGFLVVGAFGAYSLGANNIASVMGVFVPVSPFHYADMGITYLSSTTKLFMLGGIAIGIGIVSFSHNVVDTVGKGITELTPVAALVVVSSSAFVLLMFASENLKNLLLALGLPPLPLVPVSSSQAVVGAIVGIALLKDWRNINYKLIGKIALGWLATPIAAGLITLLSLFIFQNVFERIVYH